MTKNNHLATFTKVQYKLLIHSVLIILIEMSLSLLKHILHLPEWKVGVRTGELVGLRLRVVGFVQDLQVDLESIKETI